MAEKKSKRGSGVKDARSTWRREPGYLTISRYYPSGDVHIRIHDSARRVVGEATATVQNFGEALFGMGEIPVEWASWPQGWTWPPKSEDHGD